MAIKLVSKTNTNGVTGTYPYGSIRDEVSPGDGTPVDTQVYGDFHQFFARMAALAGITLNDLPDNNTNGFQYYEALAKLIALGAPNNVGGEWIDAGTTFPIIPNAGTVTVDSADVKYNKYKIIGKTLFWKVTINNFTITAAGTVNTLNFAIPTALSSANIGLANTGGGGGSQSGVVYNKSILGFLNFPTAFASPNPIDVSVRLGGVAAFSTGTNNQFLDFTLISEIVTF